MSFKDSSSTNEPDFCEMTAKSGLTPLRTSINSGFLMSFKLGFSCNRKTFALSKP